jgi:hypothetical protein
MNFHGLVAKSRFPQALRLEKPGTKMGTARQRGWWTHTASPEFIR